MYIFPTRPHLPTLAELDLASLGLRVKPEAPADAKLTDRESWFFVKEERGWVVAVDLKERKPRYLPPSVEAHLARQVAPFLTLIPRFEHPELAMELIRRLARACGGVVYDTSGQLGTRDRMWPLQELERASYQGDPPLPVFHDAKQHRGVFIHPRRVPGPLCWGDVYRLLPHGTVIEAAYHDSVVGWEDLLHGQVVFYWGEQQATLKTLTRIAAHQPPEWPDERRQAVRRAMFRGAPAFSLWTHEAKSVPLLLLLVARLQELVDGLGSFFGPAWGAEPTDAAVTWGLLRELGSDLPTEPGAWADARWAAHGGVRFDDPLTNPTHREDLPSGGERQSDQTVTILPTRNRRTTVADVRAAFPDATVYNSLRGRPALDDADLFMTIIARGQTHVSVSRSTFGGMAEDIAALDLGPRDADLISEAMTAGAPTHVLYVCSDEPGSRELALDLAAWLAERYAGCATTDDLRLTGRAGWPHRPEELRQLRAGVMD